MTRFIKKYWPIAFIVLLEGILFGANYVSGTYLSGWDNVMPEFGFKTNFLRNIVGVWQEHRGLGLFDGMSHSANTLHTLFLWIMSMVLPQELLRYMFIFMMHLLGGIGMYFLLTNFLKVKESKGIYRNLEEDGKISLIAFIGALFYQYNPATIQMFYAPLESFAIHFAFLPWLTLTAFQALESGKRTDYVWFFLIVLLGSSQSFIATLFLPTVLLLGIITIGQIRQIGLIGQLKRTVFLWIGFFLINSYWLLPYMSGIPTNAPVIASAKINQMSSSENYLRNQVYGNLTNVLTLKGFMLGFLDTQNDGSSTKLMAPWIAHWEGPAGIFFYVFLLMTILGIISIVKTKHTKGFVFIAVFFIGLFFLATDTPILSALNMFLRDTIPFFREAFRFPFTKFATLFGFSYSILFVCGILFLVSLIKKKNIQKVLIACIGLTMFILTLPSFGGYFIYPSLRITIPKDYTETFAFFQNQNPYARVAILPQPSYWSWKLYDFGYRGSGFFWYGLPQPTLDRAFDPWSNENENYFWELSYAIYNKDQLLLNNIFNKYDVGYIVMDEHLLATASHYRALYIEETKELLSQIPSVTKVTGFGKITIYELVRQEDNKTVRLENDLPSVSPQYNWTDNDVAYRELGDYITNSSQSSALSYQTNQQSDDSQLKAENYIYPFRSLFTKRSVDEQEFDVMETTDSITIASKSIPDAIPVFIDKNQALVFDSEKENVIDPKNTNACYPFKNGVTKATTENSNTLSYLRLQSLDNRVCLNFGIPELWHREGYIVAITSRHTQGRPLIFALINKTAKHTEIETQLSTTKDNWETSYFILPPLSEDGKGYDVYVANDAIGRQISINDIASVRVFTFPYEDMVRMKIETSPSENQPSDNTFTISSVEHPNPAYYKVMIPSSAKATAGEATLILSQSFDAGWKAYEIQSCQSSAISCQIKNKIQETFPFLFGKELKDHIMVNNWSNGWIIKSDQSGQITNPTNQSNNVTMKQLNNQTIVLFFLPQLLEWIGFALLPLPFLFLLLKRNL